MTSRPTNCPYCGVEPGEAHQVECNRPEEPDMKPRFQCPTCHDSQEIQTGYDGSRRPCPDCSHDPDCPACLRALPHSIEEHNAAVDRATVI